MINHSFVKCKVLGEPPTFRSFEDRSIDDMPDEKPDLFASNLDGETVPERCKATEQVVICGRRVTAFKSCPPRRGDFGPNSPIASRTVDEEAV